MTIGEMSTPLDTLAKTHKVIAVELQRHGRNRTPLGASARCVKVADSPNRAPFADEIKLETW
jgi:hypothetical protein